MSTQDQNPINEYTITASPIGSFAYLFEVKDSDEIKVIKNDVDVISDSLYSVTGVGQPQGGTISFNLANFPFDEGDKLTVLRDTDIDRDTDYTTLGDVTADSLNNDEDKQLRILQELRRDKLDKRSTDKQTIIGEVEFLSETEFKKDINLVDDARLLVEGQPVVQTDLRLVNELKYLNPIPDWTPNTLIDDQLVVYRDPSGDLIFPHSVVPFTTEASYDQIEQAKWTYSQIRNHNDLPEQGRNEKNSHDKIYGRLLTTTDAGGGGFEDGSKLRFLDRNERLFVVESSESFDGDGRVFAGSGKVAALKVRDGEMISSYGAKSNEQCAQQIQAAIDGGLHVRHGVLTALISGTINTRFGQRYQGSHSASSILKCSEAFSGVVMNCGESNVISDVQYAQEANAKLATGLRIIDPLVPGGNTKTYRVERVNFVGLNIGMQAAGHANSIDDGNFFGCNTGLLIGQGAQTGSAVLKNSKFRQNYYGMHIVEHADPDLYPQTTYIYGGLYEFNIQHIRVDRKSAVQIFGGYYRDIPFRCIGGEGDVEFFGGELNAKCGKASDRSDIWPDFSWDSSNAGDDVSWVVKGRFVKLHGATMLLDGILTGTTLNRGTTFGRVDELTLKDCELKVRDKRSIQPFLANVNKPNGSGTRIGLRSDVIKNYVGNGLFQDTSKVNATYIETSGVGSPAAEVISDKFNPWGGNAIKSFRIGNKFPFGVPDSLVGKRMLLTIYHGKAIGSVSEFGGFDPSGSVGISFDLGDSDHLNQFNGSTSTPVYRGWSGQDLEDSETIGMSTFVITVTSSAGKVSVFNLIPSGDVTSYVEIYGVTLCELDSSYSVSDTENVNIGWIDSIPAISV